MKILSVSSVSSVSALYLALGAHAAEQATVVFERVNSPSLTVVHFADGRECTGRRPLAGKDGAVREGEPVLIDAGREVAFWLRQAQGQQRFGTLSMAEVCDVIVSFTPAGGAVRTVKEPTFRNRVPLVPSLEDKPACAPLSEKK